MNKDELREALPLALSSLGDGQRADVATSLIDAISGEQSGTRERLRALDYNLLSGGGFAFSWEDVFGLAEAADSASSLLADLTPADASLVLLSMVKLWRRLRSVRVPLDGDEVKVLRAIKLGCSSRNSIAATTGMAPDRIDPIISDLQRRIYKEEFPLVEGNEGTLVTRF